MRCPVSDHTKAGKSKIQKQKGTNSSSRSKTRSNNDDNSKNSSSSTTTTAAIIVKPRFVQNRAWT